MTRSRTATCRRPRQAAGHQAGGNPGHFSDPGTNSPPGGYSDGVRTCFALSGNVVMIIPVLLLILTGSFGTSIAMAMQGATFWQITLGYVAGGWLGLLAGLPLLIGTRALLLRYA